MNAILHIVTNAGKWKGSDSLDLIDLRLNTTGSTSIDLNWEGIDMADPDHFTDFGARVFGERFVNAVAPAQFAKLFSLEQSLVLLR